MNYMSGDLSDTLPTPVAHCSFVVGVKSRSDSRSRSQVSKVVSERGVSDHLWRSLLVEIGSGDPLPKFREVQQQHGRPSSIEMATRLLM